MGTSPIYVTLSLRTNEAKTLMNKIKDEPSSRELELNTCGQCLTNYNVVSKGDAERE